MELRNLGRTGVKVRPLCLGAMMFGSRNSDEGVAIMHAALDAGINFIDTADVYGAGQSEEVVGRALAGGRRDDVVLATKVHGSMGEDPNHAGNSRRWITREVESSLKRLDTDWIDLYQIHRPEPETDIEETLGVLSDLVSQGKIRYAGCSNFPASAIVESQWAARERGLTRFVTEQPPYSLVARGVEADVLPTCQRHGMGVLCWSPLGGGWLSGKWRKGAEPHVSARATVVPHLFDPERRAYQRKLDAVEELAGLAEEAGISLIHLALAFVLNHTAVTAAIIGPRTMEHFESQLGAADVQLDPALLDRIDEIVEPGANLDPADPTLTNAALDAAARRR